MSNTHTKSATLRDFKTPSPARPPGWTRVLVCRFGGSSTHVEPLYDHLRSTANQVASCLRDLEKAEFTTFWARKRILLAVFDHSAYLFRIFQRQVSTSGLPVLQNRPLVQAQIGSTDPDLRQEVPEKRDRVDKATSNLLLNSIHWRKVGVRATLLGDWPHGSISGIIQG